ncbi:hypothetical protein LTR04_001653 [Oleoguttula sp. CCFEE 6159]|nr:hypothetical protein LTR04_001653 [Oleoguttula sp. CCFEE 6159]
MSSDKTSLSTTTPPPKPSTPLSAYASVSHPPHLDALKAYSAQPCTIQPLSFKVPDGPGGGVPGFLHLPASYSTRNPSPGRCPRTAAIMLSGAGGGVVGPSSIYLSLASKLASLRDGIPALRLDYRYPARNKYCVRDVQAALQHLSVTYSVSRFVLIGWSFGGAPVFTVAGDDARVVGCATVASQTAETEGVRKLAPRPLLLLHGTGDKTLAPRCSERLFEAYGDRGDRRIQLFEGDNHALTGNAARAEEMLFDFVVQCAGVDVEKSERRDVVEKEVVGDGEERVKMMRRGGDLRGGESVD